MIKEEGYIKFHCDWQKEELANTKILRRLNAWRKRLYDLRLIGAYRDGIGFGNISVKLETNEFLITGTATGNLSKLLDRHYTRVTRYDINNNSLTCHGPIMASSESLTHAMIYESIPSIKAVIHIHNRRLWEKLMYRVPTTSRIVKYGTPEMALEIQRLEAAGNMRYNRIIVMAGHEEGLISIGRDLNEAAMAFLELLD